MILNERCVLLENQFDRCAIAVGARKFGVACQQGSRECLGKGYINAVVCAQRITKL